MEPLVLTDNDKHALRVEIARGLRNLAEKLEGGPPSHYRHQFAVDIIKPNLDAHDGDVIEAVLAADLCGFMGIVSVEIPHEVL